MWFKYFKIKIIILLLGSLLFSCQEDEPVVIEEDQENLMTNKVIDLVMKVVADDSETEVEYNDEDCSIIEFPYFLLSGIEPFILVIQVNNDEEVRLVREQRDTATLRISYPVRVKRPGENFSRFVHSDEELEDLKKLICGKVVSDNILCMDFVYPFNFKMFNTQSNSFKTISVQHDEEVLGFMNDLESVDKVMIDYPIEIIRLQDGDVMKAIHNEDLISHLQTNENSCL